MFLFGLEVAYWHPAMLTCADAALNGIFGVCMLAEFRDEVESFRRFGSIVFFVKSMCHVCDAVVRQIFQRQHGLTLWRQTWDLGETSISDAHCVSDVSQQLTSKACCIVFSRFRCSGSMSYSRMISFQSAILSPAYRYCLHC